MQGKWVKLAQTTAALAVVTGGLLSFNAVASAGEVDALGGGCSNLEIIDADRGHGWGCTTTGGSVMRLHGWCNGGPDQYSDWVAGTNMNLWTGGCTFWWDMHTVTTEAS
ncbi:hypothetical protein [Saccharothrix coeruleofusca]|nr:hypothetical protein [Saccharothrix coeruleofusca]